MNGIAKRALRKIIGSTPSDSEINLLIKEAEKYPRYTERKFNFKDLNLMVPDFISAAWQVKEIFEGEEMKFSSSSAKPVIVDCGANIGASVIYFSRLYPDADIIAFEPDPAIFKYLQANLETNHVTNARVFQKAVWINDAGVMFGADGADGGSVFLEKNKLKIQSVRLKDMIKELPRIDLLKMDIEGAEVEVLKDCGEELKRIQNIFVEYHSWEHLPQQLNELLELLTSCGFRYYIRSLGSNRNAFIDRATENGMDIQLNIYGIRS